MLGKLLTAAALGLALATLGAHGGAQAAGKPEHAGKPAHAGKPDKAGKPGRDGPAAAGRDGGSAAEAIITATAAALILDYFTDDAPAGYARPAALPPGVAANLARGKPLPPGIAKKALPAPLLARLPAHPGHRYYAVGRDVVLVAVATGIIVDILKDAL